VGVGGLEVDDESVGDGESVGEGEFEDESDGVGVGVPLALLEFTCAEFAFEAAAGADPPPFVAALTPTAAAIATMITPTSAPITMNRSRPAFVCLSVWNQAIRRRIPRGLGPGTCDELDM
jgi:hypothetical protein